MSGGQIVDLHAAQHRLGVFTQRAILFGQKAETHHTRRVKSVGHAANPTATQQPGPTQSAHVTHPGYIRPVLQIHTSDQILPLVDHLSEVLAATPPDPMTSEWIATPSKAMQRWLSLELAGRLGATSAGSDGVSANIQSAFPGSLLARVLEADGDGNQPWEVEKLAWVTLDAILRSSDDPLLGRLGRSAAGSVYARARRAADLFDRYNLHRPAMIREWAAGNDSDGVGAPLPVHALWQPRLWRTVRDQIAVPSPAEAMPEILDRLSNGDLLLDLPERLFMFGLTVVPGGPGFLDLAHAVGAHHQIYLYLLQPSSVAAESVRKFVLTGSGGHPDEMVCHPLLRSWGRPAIDAAQVLTPVQVEVLAPRESASPYSGSTLSDLQSDLRSDLTPSTRVQSQEFDRSIQLHSCYGPTRQVEALRDSLLLLLASDPTLCEDDIIVLTPALERFAPLVEAVLGPSAGETDSPASATLRYRIADRSIRSSNPVLAATSVLLDMATGRFEVTTVLDFLSLAPVRARFNLTSDDLASIISWSESSNVRWGLDPQHRARHGVSALIDTNTWQAAVDRLLVGSTVIADTPTLSIGDIAPEGIEGADTDLAGKLAAIIHRLTWLAAESTSEKIITDWLELMLDTARALFAAPHRQSWQFDNLDRIAHDIAETAETAESNGGDALPRLTFSDFRRVLGHQLEGQSGRPDFFRGGITLTSLRPMRWIPHRVVCILGLDQSAFGRGSTDGDDLMAASPMLGDFDARGEGRQALLEATISASDALLIFRDGHDVRTNEPIPRATVLEELVDTLAAMVPIDQRSSLRETIELRHPRQPFDERYFIKGSLIKGVVAGFDSDALSGAKARRARLTGPAGAEAFPDPPASAEIESRNIIELSQLESFLRNPTKHHTDHILQVRLPRPDDELSTLLPINPNALDRWRLGNLMLGSVMADPAQSRDDLITHTTAVERRKGSVPPGRLGEVHESTIREVVDQILDAGEMVGIRRGPPDLHPIDIALPDDSRLIGVVHTRLTGPRPGPASVRYSAWKAMQLVESWVDLMCLVIADPSTDWRAITINPIKAGEPKGTEVWEISPLGTDSADRARNAKLAIGVAVDCLQRSTSSPVPLFPRVSRGLYVESHPESQLAGPGTLDKTPKLDDLWFNSFLSSGDRADQSVSLFYGDLNLSDLRSIDFQQGDPDGIGGSAQRFADYLWRAIDDSVSITALHGATK